MVFGSVSACTPGTTVGPVQNGQPAIKLDLLEPKPSRTPVQILIASEGSSCPPTKLGPVIVTDTDLNDSLHYQWFIDYDLLDPARRGPVALGAVAPKSDTLSQSARLEREVPSLFVDRALLNVGFGSELPLSLFDEPHLIQLFVADRSYSLRNPLNPLELPDGALETRHHWVVEFIETECQ